jgi:hypothetical protein
MISWVFWVICSIFSLVLNVMICLSVCLSVSFSGLGHLTKEDLQAVIKASMQEVEDNKKGEHLQYWTIPILAVAYFHSRLS